MKQIYRQNLLALEERAKSYNMGSKGISKYENKFVAGQKFGKYIVISGEIKVIREAKVLCKCECGFENYITCYSLLKGVSKGCVNCNNPREKELNPFWKGFNNVSGKYFNRIRRSAIKRDIFFDVSIEYFDNLLINQNFKCLLTGKDIKFSHSKKDNYTATASIDRINSKLGYVEGNLQWVHKDINLMKNHFDLKYFIDTCHIISEKYKIK